MPIPGKKSATQNNNDLWPETIPEAVKVQQQLRTRVQIAHEEFAISTVAGVDAGFEEDGTIAHAGVVVLSFPELQPLAHAIARMPVRFPYVPGFLSFREAPVILMALEQLSVQPDLIICDGQGIAHPRRLGIASHIGVLTGLPTIGCAKSLLIGHYGEPEHQRGARTPLIDKGEQIGYVLRTRPNVKPVYVSPGHRLDLEQAADLVMACTTKYRLPETTRYAHNLASHGTIPEPRR